jgi:hypothetical protein
MNTQPEHTPRRPTWNCRICETEWPCLAARSLLRVEYHADPVALRVHLGLLLHQATEDLYKLHPNPGPDPARLHARFLAWADPFQGDP